MSIQSAISTVLRAGKVARIAWTARQALRAPQHKQRAARQALARLLADARGVPLKIGQLLSNVSNDPAMKQLAKGVPPRPWSQMQPVLKRQLGQNPEQIFSSIEPRGIAASLGQVHRAMLHDGTAVAIKLRYPDIADAVAAEMRLAGLMPGFGPVGKWGFDLSGYKAMLKKNMDKELDYSGELKRQERFARDIRVDGLVVPKVLAQYSGNDVLVQSWEDGEPLDASLTWPAAERRRIAQILLRTFFTSLFLTGELHSDPHMGNLLVRRDEQRRPQVVLLDYGSTVHISRPARLALLKLIQGARLRSVTDPLACFTAMGFDAEKLAPITDTLPAMAQLLCEPFLRDAPFFPRHWNLSARMNLLLGDLRWSFRSAGPCDMLLFVRAFSGLIHQLDLLGTGLSWWSELVETVGPGLMQEAADMVLTPPQMPKRQVQGFDCLARLLRIRVMEGRTQVVSVSLPAAEVVRLKELIPEDVLPRIQEANIDLDDMIRQACARGVVPQPLFKLQTCTRSYEVWLE